MGAAGQVVTNVELIQRRVMAKCAGLPQAEKFFDMLYRNVGKPNPTGRTFSKEEVTEAWLKCSAHLRNKEDASSSSSDESSTAAPTAAAVRQPKEKAPKPEKIKKIKKKKNLD